MVNICRYILFSLSTLGFLQAAPDRPNFLWIISEDNSKHHLKLYDEAGVAMPNVEALAKDGIVFESACSNGAVCSVARTTLLTGCYAPRIGAQHHRTAKPVAMPNGLQPFPFYLKEAGYYTSNHRKTDYNVQVDMQQIWSSNKTWRARKAGQPFFHKHTLAISHESSVHFGKNAMKRSHLAEKVAHIKVPPHHPDTEIFRFTYATYQNKLQELDKQIGGILKKLKDDGLYDDTIIFYFGDHGGVLPRSKGYAHETGVAPPLIIRVPKKWQHLSPWLSGTRTSNIVNFYDFGPSLIHAAGLPLAQGFDGKPFLGKDLSKSELASRPAYAYADRFDEKYDMVRSLRKGTLKYHRNFQPFIPDSLHNFYRYRQLSYLEIRQLEAQGQLEPDQLKFFQKKPAEALYDLEKDPYELHNLAQDPRYVEQLNSMREELMQYLKQKNDLSFYPENILARDAITDPSGYGKNKHQQISTLVDIANLQLLDFHEAQPRLKAALDSDLDVERYWACITATSFGSKALPLAKRISHIVQHDSNLLVQVRAAEFLASMNEHELAKKAVEKAIETSTDAIELNLILNSAAMLYEWHPEFYQFTPSLGKAKVKSMLIKERIHYLKEGHR